MVRSIPIFTLLRTCKQVKAEITTSIIKPDKTQDQSSAPREDDTPTPSQDHPATILKNLRTALGKEPVQMLFEPSAYTDRVKRPDEGNGPKNLNPTDYALMEALCGRHLRPKLFIQETNNPEFRSWLLKLQHYRNCYWKMATAIGQVHETVHGRTFRDAHISIRFLARHASGHAELRGVADSGNAVLQMGLEVLVAHMSDKHVPKIYFYWPRIYGSPSLQIEHMHGEAGGKSLEIIKDEISEEDWMEGWEDSWYRDSVLTAIERNG